MVSVRDVENVMLNSVPFGPNITTCFHTPINSNLCFLAFFVLDLKIALHDPRVNPRYD